MNYEFNPLLHVGVEAKKLRLAAAETHKGNDNTHSGPMVKDNPEPRKKHHTDAQACQLVWCDQ